METLEAFSFVDVVVRGEAEDSLPPLISVLSKGKRLNKIKGLTYRNHRFIVKSPDAPLLAHLDNLPMPAYHLFPYKIENPVAIDIGRGCPFSCSFCSTSRFWKKQFRLKSIDRIINEIKTLKSTYQVDSFSFMDDLFTVNGEWLQTLCARLILEDLNIAWTCSARIDCVSPEVLQKMVKAGCQAIFYGVETGSPKMQKMIQKNLNLKKVPEIVEATLNSKMDATLSFIAGFCEESEDDLMQTMDLIQTLISGEINVQLLLLAPQVGTLEYDLHSQKLRFDGYFSDIAGLTSEFLEKELFRQIQNSSQATITSKIHRFIEI